MDEEECYKWGELFTREWHDLVNGMSERASAMGLTQSEQDKTIIWLKDNSEECRWVFIDEGTGIAVGVGRNRRTDWSWNLLSQDRFDDRPWIEAAPDGTLHVIWNDGRGVSYAVSEDNGRSWEERPRIYPSGGSSHLAVGPAGKLAVRITPISGIPRMITLDSPGDRSYVLISIQSDGRSAAAADAGQSHRSIIHQIIQ